MCLLDNDHVAKKQEQEQNQPRHLGILRIHANNSGIQDLGMCNQQRLQLSRRNLVPFILDELLFRTQILANQSYQPHNKATKSELKQQSHSRKREKESKEKEPTFFRSTI